LTCVGAYLGALSIVLGFAFGFVAIVPRPVVTSSDPVDSSNAFSVSFTVANNGFIPLCKVDAVLAFKNITYSGVVFRGYGPEFTNDAFVRFSVEQWNNHYLGMDDRFTVTPAETFMGAAKLDYVGRLEDACIAIIVTYQPCFLPKWFRREKEYRFKTHR